MSSMLSFGGLPLIEKLGVVCKSIVGDGDTTFYRCWLDVIRRAFMESSQEGVKQVLNGIHDGI